MIIYKASHCTAKLYTLTEKHLHIASWTIQNAHMSNAKLLAVVTVTHWSPKYVLFEWGHHTHLGVQLWLAMLNLQIAHPTVSHSSASVMSPYHIMVKKFWISNKGQNVADTETQHSKENGQVILISYEEASVPMSILLRHWYPMLINSKTLQGNNKS